jgi:hypothetical protein
MKVTPSLGCVVFPLVLLFYKQPPVIHDIVTSDLTGFLIIPCAAAGHSAICSLVRRGYPSASSPCGLVGRAGQKNIGGPPTFLKMLKAKLFKKNCYQH